MKIYIVSHGDLSKGILDSVEMITGKQKEINIFQLKPGKSPDSIAGEIEKHIKNNHNKKFLIFTDLIGGSVHNSVLKLALYKNVNIVSGFNLGMIIDSILSLNDENCEVEIENIIKGGKEGIKLINKEILDIAKGGENN